jgi:protein-S-isoprenylcysteine O-methyltransferase Ste14
VKANDFEFRRRGWFIGAIFCAAFGSYFFEPVNTVDWLLTILNGFGLEDRWVSANMGMHLIFGTGAVLLAAGAWLRTWGTAYLRNEVVRDRVVHAERLIADGPYRYVRNPLYFGNILLAAGLAPMAPPVGAVILVVGMTIFVLRLIGREEAFLLESQGNAYRQYLERVPRLWPALRPRVSGGGAQPRWIQAWAGELWMWVLTGAAIAFAITFNPGLFDGIAWGGIILFLIVRAIMVRRARPRQV